MKIRQFAVLFIFFNLCFGLMIFSYKGHFNDFGAEGDLRSEGPKSDILDESFFKEVKFYSIEKSKPNFEMEASELSISNTEGFLIGINPVGIIYRYDQETKKGIEPIYFQSKNSRVYLKKKEVFLENEVNINIGASNIKSKKVSILSAGDLLYAFEGVNSLSYVEKTNDQIIINSINATYRPKLQTAEYHQNVNGVIKRKRLYEESVSFKTDLLTYNGPLSLVEMKGNVALKKDNLDAFSHRGEVFLENYNKKLKYYALYDDVRLQEKLTKTKRPIIRKAFSEKLEGFIGEKKIILTGLPKVFQERDVIKGNKIIVRENVETVEVDDANTNITLEKDVEK